MANYDLDYEGSVVQDILDTGKSLEDDGYIFLGTATPSTIPGTPIERVAYVGGSGTYNNFGTTVVVPSGSIVVITYSGSAWSKTVINASLPVSTTLGSDNTTIPTSKAVKDVTDAIMANIGNGYVYAGIATPTGTPVTGKVFYIATAAGTYTHFGGLTVTQGINILKFSGTAWSQEQVFGIDDVPTAGSDNLVKSGGVDKDIHILTQKINNITNLVPTEVIEGFMNSAGNIIANEYFEVWKFAIQPQNIYFYSGRYSVRTSHAYYIRTKNSNNEVLQNIDNITGDVSKKDIMFVSANNSAYAYLNVQKDYKSSFCLSEYINNNDYIFENKSSIKSYGLGGVNTILYRFYDSGGNLTANNGMLVIIYDVKPSCDYRFSCRVSSLNTAFIINYLDINNEYISHDEYRNTTGQDAEFNDVTIKTPVNCRYVAMNIEISYKEDASLIKEDIPYILSDILHPKMEKLTPSAIVDNSWWSTAGNNPRSNNYLQIWKIPVTPGLVYKVTGSGAISASSWKQGLFLDSSENIISYFGGIRNTIGPYEYTVVAPKNATYMYINVDKGTSTEYKVELCGTTEDRTNDVKEKLESFGHCKLASGLYYINGLDMPDYAKLEGNGKETIVVLSGSSDGYAVKLSTHNTISNIRFVGAIEDITISEPSDLNTISIGNRHGVLFLGNYASDRIGGKYVGNTITGCEFKNFSGGGITCDNTGYSFEDSLIVSDCRIENCGCGINIAYWSEFNRFSNIHVNKCSYGCINQGGNNSLSNCDLSGNGIGIYFNGGENKCVRYNGTLATGTNMAHGLMTGSTIDHSGLGENVNNGYGIVIINVSAGFLFTGLQFYYGKIRIIGSGSISFVNMKQGSNVYIETVSNILVLFSNITFSGSGHRYDVYTDDSLTIIDTNYLSDGNLQQVKILNSFLANGNQASIQTLAQ